MPQLDRRPSQLPPIPSSSLDITQIIGLFVELRELSHQLINQQQQLTDLLRSGPGEPAQDDLDMLPVAEVARMLSFDSKTIHRMIAEGELEAIGSGPRLRITRASVRAYIDRHRSR